MEEVDSYTDSFTSMHTSNREGEAKFLCGSLCYEGAFSIMEPAEYPRNACTIELSVRLI